MANQTKERIIALGRNYIQTKGVNGFSFADIARDMDIKKASIHYYFPSKDDLVEAVLDDFTEQFFEKLQSLEGRSLQATLSAYVAIFRSNLTQDKICLCANLAMDIQHVSASVQAKVAAYFDSNIEWLTKQLAGHEQAEMEARDFFATVQGSQLIARNQKETTYFDQVMDRRVASLL